CELMLHQTAREDRDKHRRPASGGRHWLGNLELEGAVVVAWNTAEAGYRLRGFDSGAVRQPRFDHRIVNRVAVAIADHAADGNSRCSGDQLGGGVEAPAPCFVRKRADGL